MSFSEIISLVIICIVYKVVAIYENSKLIHARIRLKCRNVCTVFSFHLLDKASVAFLRTCNVDVRQKGSTAVIRVVVVP